MSGGINNADFADTLFQGGVEGQLTVGTTAVEVKVGGSPLEGRQVITVYAEDKNIYWGYNNTVTTSTGTPLEKKQLLTITAGESISVWLIASSAGKSVRITEAG